MLSAIGFRIEFAASLWLGVQQEIPFRYANNDGAEYADVARRLARGDGFTTGLIYPAELEFGVHRDEKRKRDGARIPRVPRQPMLRYASVMGR